MGDACPARPPCPSHLPREHELREMVQAARDSGGMPNRPGPGKEMKDWRRLNLPGKVPGAKSKDLTIGDESLMGANLSDSHDYGEGREIIASVAHVMQPPAYV